MKPSPVLALAFALSLSLALPARAGGIKALIAECVHAVEHRVALQAEAARGAWDEAAYVRAGAAEALFKERLAAVFRADDDVADVALGCLCEADLGPSLASFRDLAPTFASNCPNARRLLDRIEAMAVESAAADVEMRAATSPAPAPQEPSGAGQASDEPPEAAAGQGGARATSASLPPDLAKFRRIKDQRPTFYHTQREKGFPTSGPLHGHPYSGSERRRILDPGGAFIAETSGRYFAALCMEGSGVLRDGRTVTYVSDQRFKVAPKGCLGLTATGRWVVPFHTLAVNRNQIPYGGVYYVPGTRGLRLPGGGTHDGYWFAHDTGSAFFGATDRVDMYVDREEHVAWMEANFSPSFKPVVFYRVDEATRAKVYDKYRAALGGSGRRPEAAVSPSSRPGRS